MRYWNKLGKGHLALLYLCGIGMRKRSKYCLRKSLLCYTSKKKVERRIVKNEFLKRSVSFPFGIRERNCLICIADVFLF